MSLASCLFRSAQRRSHSRARNKPSRLLAGRATKWPSLPYHEKREQPKPRTNGSAGAPDKIVIVGGGAAGFAAAEMLRRQEFRGSILMLSSDAATPVDRPNLSKDYLAGSAPEDWMPLRPDSFYDEAGIELRLNTEVIAIDTKAHHVVTANGGNIPYDRLLLATGAEPIRLPIPGADQPHVHTLRSLADCRAIIDTAKGASRALVIGARASEAAAAHATSAKCHVVARKTKRPRPANGRFRSCITRGRRGDIPS